MKVQKDFRPLGCKECLGGAGLDFNFTMAFQPIVNTTTRPAFRALAAISPQALVARA